MAAVSFLHGWEIILSKYSAMKKGIKKKQMAEIFVDNLDKARMTKEYADLIKNFVRFLVRNNMLSRSGQILKAIEAEIAKRSGTQAGFIESAGDLDDSDIKKLNGQIAGITEGKLRLEHSINKGLLGGAKLRIADKVIDASIRERLVKLYKQI